MVQALIPSLAKLKRPRVWIPAILIALGIGGLASYLILLNPGSIFVHWAQAALPERITMITFGPYPEESDFKILHKNGVKYIVTLLDPRLPYEKSLIEREQEAADKYGMTVKDFPMASIFDQKVFPDYLAEQEKAVHFLRHLDAPAYVHCYLGKHRTVHVKNALVKAGVPERYFKAEGSYQDYWDVVNRISKAQDQFNKGEFPAVLETLEPVKTKDVDVSYLRGWAHYRLGLIAEATEDFRQGLSLDPTNPRNLDGSGYCYLRDGQPVMAQRQFNAVLEQIPDEQSALVGMGLAYLRLQNKSAAAEIFRKVLQANPGDEEVEGYLKQAEGH
jgi:tetratricopeptide (TPR) repeat protein